MEKEKISFKIPRLFFNFKQMTIKKDSQFLRGIHFHNAVELVKINSGEIKCIVGEKEFVLKSGEIMFINSNVMHRLCYVKPADIYYIQIDIEGYFRQHINYTEYFINKFITSLHDRDYFLSKDEKELSEIFEKFLDESVNQKANFEAYIKAYIQLLIAFMYRNKLLTDPESYYDTEKLKGLKTVLEFIEDNYTREISLEEISKATGTDKYRLCRQFKAATGSTVVSYINFLRLSNASNQLLNTDKTIGEISFDSGFSTIQYFNKAFKNFYNCTPKAYRKQFSKKQK